MKDTPKRHRNKKETSTYEKIDVQQVILMEKHIKLLLSKVVGDAKIPRNLELGKRILGKNSLHCKASEP